MEFFLDLAWNVNSIPFDGIQQHLKNWMAREFTPKGSDELSTILDEYYRLAFIRKPEYMGWSQTEPTTKINLSDFSKDEMERKIRRRKRAASTRAR